MIKVIMIIWGAAMVATPGTDGKVTVTQSGAGATSEIVTMSQCLNVQKQQKLFQVYCYPLDPIAPGKKVKK